MKREKSKLVRDNIPDMIKESGRNPIVHIAENEEYKEKLYEKLEEEVAEFRASGNPLELVDIIEVTYALAKLQNISPESLEAMREEKARQNGIFEKKIILDSIQKTQ